MHFDTTREEIEAIFAPCGVVVTMNMLLDRDTGKFRGFSYITFADEAGAALAKERNTGLECRGRKMRIQYAKKRVARARTATGGASSGKMSAAVLAGLGLD